MPRAGAIDGVRATLSDPHYEEGSRCTFGRRAVGRAGHGSSGASRSPGAGLDVLDQKRQALLREQQRLAEALADANRAWELKAREAAVWNGRALAIVGERRLRARGAAVAGSCEVEVEWRNALGTGFPAGASVRLVLLPDFVALGGGVSPSRSRRRTQDAVAGGRRLRGSRPDRHRDHQGARDDYRRQRAIERRWIPEHEAALHRVELALDEREREDIARVRWASDRR